jgi:hypothetical protein
MPFIDKDYVSCQLSVVSSQLSAVSCQLSAGCSWKLEAES